MIGLLQRVRQAHVRAEGEVIGAIGIGLVVLVGIERGDDEGGARRLLERLLGYRIFPDTQGKMNLSVRDVNGGLLLVPQFTLTADTRKGTRPSFTPAASPPESKRLFEYLVTQAQRQHPNVAGGRFGAYMQVSLINDGPVTFWLQVPPAAMISPGKELGCAASMQPPSAAGRLFYLMGASGAGKDSLMRYAREKLASQPGVIFAHRYITRPSAVDPSGENYISLSEPEFEQRHQAGCFAMHWQSHGYRYGIGVEIDQWLTLGLKVVVNGSRAYLEQALRRYPGRLCPILIEVSPQRLRERLLARGRETVTEIEKRLQRASNFAEQVRKTPDWVVIDNEGELKEAGEGLVALLTDKGAKTL
jgi:D-tyrosyl-tRNA(Tyr) deacylase